MSKDYPRIMENLSKTQLAQGNMIITPRLYRQIVLKLFYYIIYI